VIRALVCDWDDVFTEGSLDGYFACYGHALASVGRPLDEEEIRRRARKTWGQHPSRTMAGLIPNDPQLVEQAVAIYLESLFTDRFISRVRAVPGAVETLARLGRSDLRLGLATGVNPRLLREVIWPRLGFRNVFQAILTSYDVADAAEQKPSPAFLRRVMAALAVGPEETVYVGDGPTDVKMAQAAGVEVVAVLTGYLARTEAEAMGANAVLEDVTALPEWLTRAKGITI